MYLGAAEAQAKRTYVGTTWSGGLDNFTFDDNLYFTIGGNATCSGMFNEGTGQPQDFSEWKKRGKDAHSASADPLFASPFPRRGGVPKSIALKPSSPAIKLFGFEPIDMSTVGPRSRLYEEAAAARVPAALTDAGFLYV